MRILVTGGAGFIGSNLVEALLQDDRVSFVRVLDDLSTGHLKNLEDFKDREDFEFFHGDIRDFSQCLAACSDIDAIAHQAALGSVPRSIKDPLLSNAVNTDGTLNIFYAAVKQKIKRVVFAASSSTYGDSPTLPKVEDQIGKPLSPYAVTKLVNEIYADVFSKTYDFEFIGLRYFNVFGPKQDPNGAYAAVIPLFFKAAIEKTAPTIHGDGEQSRDFTFVANAVQANIRALFTDNEDAVNQVYNIAVGERITINELYRLIQEIANSDVPANHTASRIGDVKHSLANISKAKSLMGYDPLFKVKKALEISYQWYEAQMQKDKLQVK